MKGFPIQDVYINGVQDDGTPEGVIRTRLKNGSLLKIPTNLASLRRTSSTSGAGTVTYIASGVAYNSDGTGTSLNINGVNTIGADSAAAHLLFSGSFLGIRYRVQSSFSVPFSVIIDGAVYQINGINQAQLKSHINHPVIAGDSEWTVIISDNLPDTQHTLSIVRPYHPTDTRTVVITGLIVDSNNYKVNSI